MPVRFEAFYLGKRGSVLYNLNTKPFLSLNMKEDTDGKEK